MAVFDKRDGFSFHIVNFPHMDSNIPSKPAYVIVNTPLQVLYGIECTSAVTTYSTRAKSEGCMWLRTSALFHTALVGVC